MKKLTQEEFLAKAVAVHGIGRYDYSQTVYCSSNEKLTIICPKHGPFNQTPNSHIGQKRCGCPRCKADLVSQRFGSDTAKFIEKSRAVHGDKYDYSQVEYTCSDKKVVIGCSQHGLFEQNASSHSTGVGCPKCGAERGAVAVADSVSDFVAKARAQHGERYDYSQVAFTRGQRLVKIICSQHGAFLQGRANHITGQGCRRCADAKKPTVRLSNTNAFIQKAVAIHGELFNYSQVEYIGSKRPVCISCPQHGDFMQMPNTHLLGRGCPKCGREKITESHLHDTQLFIQKARAIHSNTYDYSQAAYIKSSKKLTIICPKHGLFEQTPNSHLRGSGCAMCKDERHRLGWIAESAGRTCTLYFLRLFDETESFFKVGITFTSVEKRFSHKKGLAGYQYEVLAQHTSTNAAAVWDWEQSILQTFAPLSYKPSKYFYGRTECFSSCEEILAIFPL